MVHRTGYKNIKIEMKKKFLRRFYKKWTETLWDQTPNGSRGRCINLYPTQENIMVQKEERDKVNGLEGLLTRSI